MKVYTYVSFRWDGTQYVEEHSTVDTWDGPVTQCCGASSAQNQALSTQTNLTNQIVQQGQQVFGNSSKVFNDLVSSLSPTVANGPNQQGFSAAETSALKSQAITQSGAAARNAQQAAGQIQSAEGGGNTSDTNGGTNAGINANIEGSAAANTANELSQIDQANYATGRDNYKQAVSALGGSTSVFNPATGLDDAATSSASAEASTANQIASQNNSWMNIVGGALGAVAGSAVGGGGALTSLVSRGSGTNPSGGGANKFGTSFGDGSD